MKNETKVYVGMDVHKDSVMIAVLPDVRGSLRRCILLIYAGWQRPERQGFGFVGSWLDLSRVDLGAVASPGHIATASVLLPWLRATSLHGPFRVVK